MTERHPWKELVVFVLLIVSLIMAPRVLSAQTCPGGVGNTVYLVFPTSIESSYPEHGTTSASTSPLSAFDAADLDAGMGTTAQLREAITDIVRTDYCEFRTEVRETTSWPSPTESRWQIIGIGSDNNSIGLFGEAQAVDANDSDPQDYSRVWAGEFGVQYGGTGGALQGTNSTLERWATAVGHTVSHEAGHNYGLAHGNSAPVPGSNEDIQNNHVLATGSTGLTGENRVSRNRHFSDTSYEILGHNIGLNVSTLLNWDFVNPNNADAHALVLTLLSKASSLTINWSFNGAESPWTSPSVAATGGTQNFQGSSYNVFELRFAIGKNWSGGTNGVVPPLGEFHTGVTFSETDPVLVYETTLEDASGADLMLHPRLISFDTVLDMATGDFEVRVLNPRPDLGNIEVRDFRVQFLPRVADIQTMVENGRLTDIRGIPVVARRPRESYRPVQRFSLDESRRIRIASLTDERHVDIRYDSTDCERGIVGQPEADMATGELEYCPDGPALSLFPSTAVYITAAIVDQDARQYNPATGEFEVRPLETKVFYQFVGIVPDLNENGVDDLLDIRNGDARDENQNGVPDEAEAYESEKRWWIWGILVLVVVLTLVWVFYVYRKSNNTV